MKYFFSLLEPCVYQSKTFRLKDGLQILTNFEVRVKFHNLLFGLVEECSIESI